MTGSHFFNALHDLGLIATSDDMRQLLRAAERDYLEGRLVREDITEGVELNESENPPA